MKIYKCKMCGGSLEISNETIATCVYCGIQQTVPKLDDERRLNLYDRANHFRRNNEFDKAMGIYEQLLNEDNTDAEAYWSLVLCRYGIEYVEEPSTHNRIITVNRAQYTSVFDDDNYKSALQYADEYQRKIYEDEAKAINEIQKGILAISQKEAPFDVFICYKETDNYGRRTPDSVLANDLYHQLTQEGFKVFFARITLEDKLGTAYEPYIFAALNSAKVMVVLGTKPEFFKAVWVRNEWSRYLSLIKQGQKKMLIPAYKDMDPYDLPEEFSHLQAQDMAKLGFMQDLIRGIKKIIKMDTVEETASKEMVINGVNANAAPLMKRAFMFLEDRDWNSANEYCEKVLDIDPENALAYLGKLMFELQVRNQDSLKDCVVPFDTNKYYQKAIRFADDNLKSFLIECINHINDRNEHERLEGIYLHAKKIMASANTEMEYKEAARLFETISEYMDSFTLIQECYEKAEHARKDAILFAGKSKMYGVDIANYEFAIQLFESITGWKDAEEKISDCKKKIEEIKIKEETDRFEREKQEEIARKEAERIAKRNKKIVVTVIAIVCLIILLIWVFTNIIIPNSKYRSAIELMNEGESEEAYKIFQELGDYKDSSEKAGDIRFVTTKEQLKNIKVGDYIKFGAYEHDSYLDNGKEDIEWLVLKVEDGMALLISKYILDCKKYHNSNTEVTWERCSLREWLNSEFINSAFSSVEENLIATVELPAIGNPNYGTNSGNPTEDRLFILSISEANEFFATSNVRTCKPTVYSIANGVYSSDMGYSCWWLRTPGSLTKQATYVRSNGEVSEHGTDVGYEDIGVRPALWISLNY